MNLIDEFWIINFHGVPLFKYPSDDDLDSHLIGAFFSAVQKFSSHLDSKTEQYINSLMLKKNAFHFLINQKYRLYFISKSSKKTKSKLINPHLKELAELFIGEFEEDIINFDGEITFFNRFLPIFEEYFENKLNKLKSMW